MKKPIMIHVLALFLISTLAGCASCSSDLKENGKENGKEEKPDTEEVRPESFASDDEMLDYIQKVHLNYMWDGAEPTSGLARERIHLDGDYPEKDQNVVTTGGSGFGKTVANLKDSAPDATIVEGKLLNGTQSVAGLKSWVDSILK